MKKIFILIIALSFIACNDGDFEVPAFEFTETINTCNNTFFYKTSENETEVLYLTLKETQFTTTSGEKSISISSSSPVTYRIFDDKIGPDYFCQIVPPTAPTVLKELVAEDGEIIIITSEILNSNGEVTGYSYDITFKNVLFMDDSEKVYFETLNFGNITVNN